MRAYVLKRLLWMVPTLLGISFVTFLLIELAPGDRALAEAQQAGFEGAQSVIQRHERVQQLRVRHGLIDPETGQKRSLLVGYGRWLKNAFTLRFEGPAGGGLGRRVRAALPVTALVNALAILFALALAIPLGVRAGMRTGGGVDRVVSTGAFVVQGVPEFLLATLFVLVFGGAFFGPLLPVAGLSSDVAGGGVGRLWDTAQHLVLPVLTLGLGYAALLFRFLRESVARAARSDFALALRGYGASEAVIRRRVLRNGLSPVITLLGSMLPVLVGGTVVVETMFQLPGIGRLTVQAVQFREMELVMALTMLVSVATLVSFLVSDVCQRLIDPRVALR